MIKFRKLQKNLLGKMLAAALIAGSAITAYAMDDGAYTVVRTTSYVNPETGQTADGGTNIALGDSMCASIVEETVLVEQSQGKTYVTLGIGLMSNVSDVRIQVQGTDGAYKDAEITQTGSCERNGDMCNHYRFEVDSADLYISPILYVAPMGRDVQFYVKLDMSAPQPGTGDFVSEMIKAEVPKEQASEKTAAEETEEQKTEEVKEASKEADTKDQTSDENEEKSDNHFVMIAGAAVILVLAGAAMTVIKKKRKK